MAKLVVVTGKGGAGKSVLALAMAHRLSTEGKRVWLVELGRKRDREFSRLPELVGRTGLGHEPEEVTLPATHVKLLVSVLDPAQSLAEYVDLKLPTGGLAGVLLNNRVTASFLEVVPGLPDLVQLGKLWHAAAVEKNVDTVVLDAPATGHALGLLKAPDNFRRITRVGPIYKDANQMAEFLADPASTELVLASLPEEMSVQETLELQKLLGKDFPKPRVFVNKLWDELPKAKEDGDSAPARAYRYARARGEREHEAAAALRGAKCIPFFFPEPGAPPLYLRVSGVLA